jgi:hypothetical protein
MAYVKPHQKANFFKHAVLIGACIALTACADSEMLNSLTGEPSAGAMANRAGILRVDSQEAVWPNLASVPERPTDVPPIGQREAQKDQLESERYKGLSLLEAKQVVNTVATKKVAHPAAAIAKIAPASAP